MTFPPIRPLIGALAVALATAACGTTDPGPVGINQVDLTGGDVVEIADVRPTLTTSKFREIFPSILGEAQEMLIGRMNGVVYTGLIGVTMDPIDFPGGSAQGLEVDSLFIELQVLGSLVRGVPGTLVVSRPDEAWTETRSFVDTTDFQRASFTLTPITESIPSVIDSTVRVPLPVELLADAIAANPSAPALEFALTGADGEPFLIVAGSKEAPGEGKVPELVARFSGGGGARVGVSRDTYYADRLTAPADGELLLQTGVNTAATMQFELPDIPKSATVNVVELSMDFDFDRSFLASLRLRVERLDVAGGDTTAVIVSGNALNEQVVSPLGSPFRMNLDQLMFHGWMSGLQVNNGLSITPVFEITADLRYEWGLFTNPRIRVVYSLPPEVGS